MARDPWAREMHRWGRSEPRLIRLGYFAGLAWRRVRWAFGSVRRGFIVGSHPAWADSEPPRQP